MEKKDGYEELKSAIAWLKGLGEIDEYFETIANLVRKMFDALITVGFTEDQAIRIAAGFASKSDNKT